MKLIPILLFLMLLTINSINGQNCIGINLSSISDKNDFKVYLENESSTNLKDTIDCNTIDLNWCVYKVIESIVRMKDTCQINNLDSFILTERQRFSKLIEDSNYNLPAFNSGHAGIIKVSRSIPIIKHFIGNSSSQVEENQTLICSVKSIDIVIKDGYLEEIKAILYNPSDWQEYTFISGFPIGFSSLRSFRDLQGYSLYLLEGPVRNYLSTVSLVELIQYIPNSGLNRKDFVPKDDKYVFKPGAYFMNKQETEKFFEARLFTDVQGFSGEKPNGLAQVEIEKKFNLNTELFPSSKKKLPKTIWGFNQYIIPFLGYNKVEVNNKFLPLRTRSKEVLENGEIQKSFTTNALALQEYQIFNTGVRSNIVKFINGNQKIRAYLDGEIRMGLTQSQDSVLQFIENEFEKTGEVEEISNFHLTSGLSLCLQFYGDERFSFNVVNRWLFTRPMGQDIYLPVESTFKNNSWSGFTVHEIEAALRLSPENDARIFARARLWGNYRFSSYFTQIQLGTSFYLKG